MTRRQSRGGRPEESLVAGSLSPALRRHVLAGAQPSEHRTATVAFLRFEGADALIAAKGADRAADVLRELIAAVGAAADERQVCFLGSDIDADGGKIILTAGAPRATGDEEERMLLVLRRIVDDGLPLPVRIGVHRGALFAGDIGPHYRRTYTVMGDVVNLAARLMAKAPPGEIYATAAVVDRSPTRFRSAPLEPFMVKGKVRPVHALSIGPVRARRGKGDSVPIRFPLIGRDHELALLARALDDASRGQGRLIELVSEPGMGRSRLMEELRDGDADFRALHVTCEAYATATPYRAWRGLLRELAGVGWEDPDEAVLERLRRTLTAEDPALLPWLPLLAIAFDMDAPATAEVEQLAPAFRAPKLREVILRFVRGRLPGWALIEFEDAHLMDEASAELMHTLEQELPLLPWLVVVTRRDTESGFIPAPGPHLVRLELGPLDPEQALALAHAVTEASPLPPHVVRTAAERSGGSPQFLRDLLRAAAAGSSDLPDSVEAAATTRMDRLSPADRELIRRASVLGVSFHRRHLDALRGGDVPAPTAETWERLAAYFADDGHGYLRFRRRLVCDVAYAGMSFRVRRELHAAAGMLLERELGPDADDEAARLCVHFLLAGRHARAWRYARLAAERAAERSAFADAAQLYRRALEAASPFRRARGRGRRRVGGARPTAWLGPASSVMRTSRCAPRAVWPAPTRSEREGCCSATPRWPSAPGGSSPRSAGRGERCERSTVSMISRHGHAALARSRCSRRCGSARDGWSRRSRSAARRSTRPRPPARTARSPMPASSSTGRSTTPAALRRQRTLTARWRSTSGSASSIVRRRC